MNMAETDIKKVAKFDKAVEAAKRFDRHNDERASHWGELGIWSTRRLGQLLKEGKEQGVLREGRHKKRSRGVTVFSLSDLALTKMQSSRAQQIANLSEKALREHIAMNMAGTYFASFRHVAWGHLGVAEGYIISLGEIYISAANKGLGITT